MQSCQISQLHPFDAPLWRAPPNYGTDAGVIQLNWIHSGDIVGANNDWPHLFIVRAHCLAATHFHMHPPTGHTQATFTRLEDILLPVFQPGGQLDCRRSPARAWKPEANQCGFASASSTLE
ncbi:hypothetical protein O181_073795 [Austropuccinia psidii MF-1]|uniref:Uncharacterized protein n=1 Tax=Austropuccinia psidii MF-1 TaxID=1389203 RepID=A0A9Q3FB90_9BASI|nr:hypothetical protein [Austropuccinia psidii MF-1]